MRTVSLNMTKPSLDRSYHVTFEYSTIGNVGDTSEISRVHFVKYYRAVEM